jgi:hypothetical protein
MLPSLSLCLGVVALLLSHIAPVDARVMRGLGWATDSRFAPNIAWLPRIEWYYHWQMGPISQMPKKLEYVPQFWGPQYWSDWNQRKGQMNAHVPQHLLSFNEPDVSSQSNMDPSYAASLYMQEINPWGKRGVTLGSPAIAYNLNWMSTFLGEIKNKGGKVDFVVLHWYGSWNDIATFKKYVTAAHNRFGKPIWVTEFGITTASRPSQAQVKNFMMQAFAWMDAQGYVQRAVWFGCFESDHPPDGYATGKNALLKPGGAVGDMGFWYSYSDKPNKRSHLRLARDVAPTTNGTTTNEDGEDISDAVYCNDTCEKLRAQLAEDDAAPEPGPV